MTDILSYYNLYRQSKMHTAIQGFCTGVIILNLAIMLLGLQYDDISIGAIVLMVIISAMYGTVIFFMGHLVREAKKEKPDVPLDWRTCSLMRMCLRETWYKWYAPPVIVVGLMLWLYHWVHFPWLCLVDSLGVILLMILFIKACNTSRIMNEAIKEDFIRMGLKLDEGDSK